MSKKYHHRSIEYIAERWEKDEKHYKELQKLVSDFLNSEINEIELLPTITSRVKSLNSIIKTALKKEKKYHQLRDKVGFRIVCHFKSDLEKVNQFIKDNFIIKEYESKEKKLKENEFGYLSDHFIVKINTEKLKHKVNNKLKSIYFEIQVRTLCQHTWADVQHDILYKEDISLDETSRRMIYRIASLLEISDDEFERVNNKLIGKEEYIPFLIMKKIEGKFFKYAKRNYDKDISYNQINKLLPLFKDISNVSKEVNFVVKFIEKNDNKIRRIFSERVNELKKDIFLSQPEIFLVWYFLEVREFDLIKEWKKHFDIDDLERYSLFWGKTINPYNE